MFEKPKPIVEDFFVKEIKGQLKEGKTVGFIDNEPSKNATKLTTYTQISPMLLFHEMGMPTIKRDVIQSVANKLNEVPESNFIFYRPMEIKIEYHYEKTYPSAKEPEEFWVINFTFNVEKY